MAKFEELKGREIVAVDGLEVGSERVVFTCADGTRWTMHHAQDCCESVDVQDIAGDPADLTGLVLDAREESGDTDPEGYQGGEYRDSFTWTFYVIQTNKGAVTIRWLGESNGYYGETPYFGRAD